MRRLTIWMLALIALAACSGGSTHPSRWQPAPGASGSWVSSTGPDAQKYTLEKKSYSGSIQDLASDQVKDVEQRYKGARLIKSDAFLTCPGRAAIAEYTYGKGQALQQGISTDNGSASIVTYIRPAGMQPDEAAEKAMQFALCGTNAAPQDQQ